MLFFLYSDANDRATGKQVLLSYDVSTRILADASGDFPAAPVA